MRRLVVEVEYVCPVCHGSNDTILDLYNGEEEGLTKIYDIPQGSYRDALSTLSCDECSSEHNVRVRLSRDGCEVVFEEHPLIPVKSGFPYVDNDDDNYEWLDDEINLDPYRVFVSTCEQAVELLTSYGGDDGAHLINRMAFSQIITALEAFLCDTMIRGVREKPDALNNLIRKEKDLSQKKFSLSEIASNGKIVEETTEAYLRSLLYHNLPKIDVLYQIAFGVEIFGSADLKAWLNRAISLRHDCVHRNGRDKDDKPLNVFTKAYVVEIADTLTEVVGNIDDRVWQPF